MPQQKRYWWIQRHEFGQSWDFDQMVEGRFEDAVSAAKITLNEDNVWEIRFGEWNPNTCKVSYTVYMPQW